MKNSKSFYKYIIHFIFILISISFIAPLIMVISVSLSSQNDLVIGGFKLLPEHISFEAYKLILKNPATIISSYKVTVIMSFIGLIIYLVISSMCAYALSRRDFKYRKKISFYLFFTMLFSGGLVPYYIVCTQYLQLRNSYAALIIPLLGNVWYMFLMRTFFQDIPVSVIESCTIDGANEWQIYIKIILPLSKPVLATVGLLQLLGNWNSWFHVLLFIDDSKYYPLQYLLQGMLRNIQELQRGMQGVGASYIQLKDIPTEPLKMAMCLLAIGPMLVIFPFFQKYFVKGLTIGSVKG